MYPLNITFIVIYKEIYKYIYTEIISSKTPEKIIQPGIMIEIIFFCLLSCSAKMNKQMCLSLEIMPLKMAEE